MHVPFCILFLTLLLKALIRCFCSVCGYVVWLISLFVGDILAFMNSFAYVINANYGHFNHVLNTPVILL